MTTDIKMRSLQRALVVIGVTLMVLSTFLPWLSASLVSVSLSDIYRQIASKEGLEGISSVFKEFERYPGISSAIFLSILFHSLAVLFGVAAILAINERIALLSGFFSLASGGLWIFAVEAIKVKLSADMLGALIAQMLGIGLGCILVVVAGVLILLSVLIV